MNYVLQHKGAQKPTNEDIEKIRSVEGVRVLEASAFSVLAEVTPEALRDLSDLLPDWDVAPEVTYAPPTTKKSVQDEG